MKWIWLPLVAISSDSDPTCLGWEDCSGRVKHEGDALPFQGLPTGFWPADDADTAAVPTLNITGPDSCLRLNVS